MVRKAASAAWPKLNWERSMVFIRGFRSHGARALVFAGVVAAAGPAMGHDFFLLPETFAAAPGGGVLIDANISAAFPKLERSVGADRMQHMRVHGSGKVRPLAVSAAGPGAKLAFQGAQTGDAVMAVALAPREVEYAEDQIPVILDEYGIGGDAAAAVANLVKPRTLKAVSSRFAKSIVCVGACATYDDAARPVGFDLEFVAADAVLERFALLARGKPLANHPVAFVGGDGVRRHAATDATGSVLIPRGPPGPLMLFAAAMAPPSSPEGRFDLRLTSLTLERSNQR